MVLAIIVDQFFGPATIALTINTAKLYLLIDQEIQHLAVPIIIGTPIIARPRTLGPIIMGSYYSRTNIIGPVITEPRATGHTALLNIL